MTSKQIDGWELIKLAPSKCWDHPKREIQGDATEDQIFFAVGKALSQWEMLEEQFARMFGLFVGGNAWPQSSWPQSYLAERAYGLIVSGQARVSMLKEVAAAFFYIRGPAPEQKATFDILLKHFAAAGEIRNCIAHGLVRSWMVKEKHRGAFLGPPDHSTKKNYHRLPEPPSADHIGSARVAYRYTSDQILEFSEKFHALRHVTIQVWAMLEQKFVLPRPS